MNTKTKLSLVAILASCFCMAIGSPGRGASSPSACAAQPGTMRALFCPAPAALTKPSHHRHAKA